MGACYTLSVEELKEEMTIDTFFVPNVVVRGTGMSVRHCGVLMLCVDFPGGCILESIDISVDPKDPSKGRVDVDLSPALSVPETRFTDECVDQEFGNPVLAEMFCNQLQRRFERDSVPGSMPLYRHITKKFNWPKGRKSELMPADPYCSYFRPDPTAPGQTFYSIKQVQLRVGEIGMTVPAYCVSALFYSAEIEARASRGGRGLMLPIAYDDAPPPAPPGRGYPPAPGGDGYP
jgi:hypothetical protein